MNPNGNIANLQPFKPGHKLPRASAAKMRALSRARLASPEAVEFNLAVMRDPEEAMKYRLKASENILRPAFPVTHAAVESEPKEGTRFLDVVFVHRKTEGAPLEYARAPSGAASHSHEELIETQPITVSFDPE